ncbi:LacI family DNA-binding transcriptional regulator [Streptosporangium sp. NPDC023963]|uniref:LacI family DNA-binding transcriptional regulator n=1 Tax=Streptosporangium sp. NPDC023963 TaxID=3155608 RepID=UPI00341F128D
MVEGEKAPRRRGMRSVAEEAGVSLATVSNVLNSPDVVAKETQQRVQAAMDRLGYVPNNAARRLRGLPSSLVGAVTLDMTNPFFTEVCRGIEDRLLQDDCMLMMCSTDMQPGREQHYLRELEKHGVRGVLITPVDLSLRPLLAMARRGVPIVLVDHRTDQGKLCSVSMNNVMGGRLAADHLLRLGHRRIAVLSASVDVQQTIDRRSGVREACAAAGHDPDKVVLDVRVPAPDMTTAETVLDDVLADPVPPTAILCLTDLAAMAVVGGLRERGVDVPGDISVVGYDDLVFAAQMTPSLTTVWQPKRELGHTAAGLLLDETRPGHRHRRLVYRPRLVVRSSTASPKLS